MNTSEINFALRQLPYFKGTIARDMLPTIAIYPSSYVVNTDSAGEVGEHWVAIRLTQSKNGEYFDSFGLPPLHPDIVNFMYTNCESWCYNNITLQHFSSICCGLYCIKYLEYRAKNTSYNNFLGIFSNNQQRNDQILKNI